MQKETIYSNSCYDIKYYVKVNICVYGCIKASGCPKQGPTVVSLNGSEALAMRQKQIGYIMTPSTQTFKF